MKSTKLSKLPIQSSPVIRNTSGSAISGQNGVEASGWWDVVKKVGSGIGTVGDVLFG